MRYTIDTKASRFLGVYLRELRIRREISLRRLAIQNEIDPAELSRWELGQRGIGLERILYLARAYQTDPEKILTAYRCAKFLACFLDYGTDQWRIGIRRAIEKGEL